MNNKPQFKASISPLTITCWANENSADTISISRTYRDQDGN